MINRRHQKRDIEFLEEELYAAGLENARLRQQVNELSALALLGAGVRAGLLRFHVSDNAKRDLKAETMYHAILAGEYGELS